jgi:hypothetical protein
MNTESVFKLQRRSDIRGKWSLRILAEEKKYKRKSSVATF